MLDLDFTALAGEDLGQGQAVIWGEGPGDRRVVGWRPGRARFRDILGVVAEWPAPGLPAGSPIRKGDVIRIVRRQFWDLIDD